jgi:quercetin dioxygenase-like cupin family protein
MPGDDMERADFIAALAEDGFAEAVTVEREANGFLDVHAHPFEAKAFILDGEIRLCIDGTEQTYKAGHVFHLPANAPHSEAYGPEGVRYLVGRK